MRWLELMDSDDDDREHLRQLRKAPPATVRRPPAQLTNTAFPNSKLCRRWDSLKFLTIILT